MYCACSVLYSTCATVVLVKSPEVTLCGYLGYNYNYKPSINNNNINNQAHDAFGDFSMY